LRPACRCRDGIDASAGGCRVRARSRLFFVTRWSPRLGAGPVWRASLYDFDTARFRGAGGFTRRNQRPFVLFKRPSGLVLVVVCLLPVPRESGSFREIPFLLKSYRPARPYTPAGSTGSVGKRVARRGCRA
jgi:hypothetical protein